MKKSIMSLLILIFSVILGWFSFTYLFGKWILLGIFFSGTCFGIFLMTVKLFVKNDKLNSYKRELEKESVNADENAARVKVLESKIEVLEKALENALNK